MRPSPLPRLPGSRLSHTLSRLRTPPRPTLLPRATPLPPVAPPQRDWPPELLAAVALEPDSVARGSFGEVFKGVDRATGAAVAVKVVSTKRPAGTKSALDTAAVLSRLHREVDLMGAVAGCGNVVQLRAVHEDSGHAYVVLDFVDGGDVEEWLKAKDEVARAEAGSGGGAAPPPPPVPVPATEAEAALLTFELLKVLTACHAAGVVHGDVKPANIMIRRAEAAAALAAVSGGGGGGDGGVGGEGDGGSSARPSDGRPFLALSDFGLARSAAAGMTTGTRGTPVFMAPEVFRGAYGPPADVWAVGVTAFYLLTRRYPWWPTQAEVLSLTPRGVRATVLHPEVGTFKPAADPDCARLSRECVAFLAACLSRDPAARPTALAALAHPWFAAALPAGSGRAVGEVGRAIAASAAAAAVAASPPPIDGDYDDDGEDTPLPLPDAAALAAFVGVLAHNTMGACEACTFETCPLSGAAARALDRVEMSEGDAAK